MIYYTRYCFRKMFCRTCTEGFKGKNKTKFRFGHSGTSARLRPHYKYPDKFEKAGCLSGFTVGPYVHTETVFWNTQSGTF